MEVLNLPGAARVAGITPAAVRYWILIGCLKATKAGNRWIITRPDLDAAIEQSKHLHHRGRRGPRDGQADDRRDDDESGEDLG